MINSLKKILQKTIHCPPPISKEQLKLQQEQFFRECMARNTGSWLTKESWIDDHEIYHQPLHKIIALLWLYDYQRLKPFIDQWVLTKEKPLYFGRTSWTSDGNNGGKDIPITKTSLKYGEQRAIKNTLCSIIFELWGKFLLQGKALVLSGGFDGERWYISWIINHTSGYFGDLVRYPSKEILAEPDRTTKKQMILSDLRANDTNITSLHGVPTRPLELIEYVVQEDLALAQKTFGQVTYVSIGGWPPLDYKVRYKNLFDSLWATHPIAFTNNHNATEWFFGSQQRNFTDLSFHWMVPHIWGNRFGYIPLDKRNGEHTDLSYLIWLHEVLPTIEYVQIILNDRIPVPYIIKDIVVFNTEGEYLVTGRVGMASNIANEHIEQKHILECLKDLNKTHQRLSEYFALAGMELTKDNKLLFHWIIEKWSDSLNTGVLGEGEIEERIHHRFVQHHEQYRIFAWRWKIIGCKVTFFDQWEIIQQLGKQGRRHAQSKIPHIGNENYTLIQKLRKQY